MATIIVVKELAKYDIDEIFLWYESKKEGLGLAFIIDFDNTIIKIKRNPFYAGFIEGKARNASLKKFPYNIIFTIEENIVFVHAVIHQSRNPLLTSVRL